MELFAELFRVYRNKPMSLSVPICMVTVSICMRGKEEEQPDVMISLFFFLTETTWLLHSLLYF